jgi:sigma-E factor negative regulatory protein RseC
MTDNSKIEHKGIVKEISDDTIIVKIEPIATCTSCRARTLCGADNEDKIVEIQNWHEEYSLGDSVIVMMEQSLGYKALFYGYIAPFFVIMISIVILISLGINEGISGLISLLLLAPYYLTLYYYRDKIKKQFTFSITKNYF